MKKIRVKTVGFQHKISPEIRNDTLFFRILDRLYDVEYVDDDPDYIICKVYGEVPYDYCKFPQVRVMLSEENYIPDFNLIDYAVSSYPISYYDRAFRCPEFAQFRDLTCLENRKCDNGKEFLDGKKYFACFIYRHESEFGIRGDFFKLLSKYKRVESGGPYLNNMPDGQIIWYEDKIEFQKKCKFSLCFESTKHEGFITEKITDAFIAGTIPIYYGSSDISEIFNKKAFINVSDYNSSDEVIERIIELDNDDAKYLEMINQPVFNDPHYYSDLVKDFEKFITNIFDQDKESAYRRSRVFCPKRHNDFLIRYRFVPKLFAFFSLRRIKKLYRKLGHLVKELFRKILRKK